MGGGGRINFSGILFSFFLELFCGSPIPSTSNLVTTHCEIFAETCVMFLPAYCLTLSLPFKSLFPTALQTLHMLQRAPFFLMRLTFYQAVQKLNPLRALLITMRHSSSGFCTSECSQEIEKRFQPNCAYATTIVVSHYRGFTCLLCK